MALSENLPQDLQPTSPNPRFPETMRPPEHADPLDQPMVAAAQRIIRGAAADDDLQRRTNGAVDPIMGDEASWQASHQNEATERALAPEQHEATDDEIINEMERQFLEGGNNPDDSAAH